MEVSIKCSQYIKNVLEELLDNRNIVVNENSNVCIIENGYELDEGKIGVVFQLETINILIQYLDEISSKEEVKKNIIAGRYNDRFEIINYENILYFEGLGNDVFCITKDKQYKVKEKLYEIELQLGSEGFIRVSKGFIVNISKVKEIIPWFNSKLLLKMEESEREIDVTRKYIKEFKKFLGM